MKRRVILLFSIILIVFSSFVNADIITMTNTTMTFSDCRVAQNGNDCASTSFQVYAKTAANGRGYIGFDFSKLADVDTFDNVVVSIQLSSSFSSRNVKWYNFTDVWGNSLTWANQPCGTTLNSLSGPCSGGVESTVAEHANNVAPTFNITDVVNDYFSQGIKNISFVAAFTPEDSASDIYAIWHSSESGAKPSLSITYRTITNTQPNTPTPTLVSVDGTNNTKSDLNCSATITDDDGDNMNVTVEWFRNTTLYSSYSLNNNYANGTTVSNILSSGNLSINDSWICSMQSTDGTASSDWGNSTALNIIYDAYWTYTNISTSTTTGVRGDQFIVQVDVSCSSGTADCDGNAGTIHLDPILQDKVIMSDSWYYDGYFYVELI